MRLWNRCFQRAEDKIDDLTHTESNIFDHDLSAEFRVVLNNESQEDLIFCVYPCSNLAAEAERTETLITSIRAFGAASLTSIKATFVFLSIVICEVMTFSPIRMVLRESGSLRRMS